jgi:manganese transport protein
MSRSRDPLLATACHHADHAIGPALAGIFVLGDRGVGSVLVVSQMVLSLQFRSAICPLIVSVFDRGLMQGIPVRVPARFAGWTQPATITAASVWLLSLS